MSNDQTQAMDMTEIREGDILFDCPFCGKNMAIEAAGSGLMVPCAGCGRLNSPRSITTGLWWCPRSGSPRG